MQFGAGGQPEGGKVSNFLLEKSRVTSQNPGERSFHIFYQLCCGTDQQTKREKSINCHKTGKYVEMQFGAGGQPEGGKVSNFLLEKSRVTSQNPGERSFHIFYQLCCGTDQQTKRELGLVQMELFLYLSGGGSHKVEGTNDAHDFNETLKGNLGTE
ncbi:Unconventional myosin-Ie [Homalodisca vitripennis]|nr:Unconventional myosin-Ie [Homalodisca vitripennis]